MVSTTARSFDSRARRDAARGRAGQTGGPSRSARHGGMSRITAARRPPCAPRSVSCRLHGMENSNRSLQRSNQGGDWASRSKQSHTQWNGATCLCCVVSMPDLPDSVSGGETIWVWPAQGLQCGGEVQCLDLPQQVASVLGRFAVDSGLQPGHVVQGAGVAGLQQPLQLAHVAASFPAIGLQALHRLGFRWRQLELREHRRRRVCSAEKSGHAVRCRWGACRLGPTPTARPLQPDRSPQARQPNPQAMQQVARLLTGYARMSFRAASAVTIDGIQLAVPRDSMTGR